MTDESNRNNYLDDAEIEAAQERYDRYVRAKGEMFELETVPLSEAGQKALMRKYWIAIFGVGMFAVIGVGTVYYMFTFPDHRPQIWLSVAIFFFVSALCYREALRHKRQTSGYRVKGIVTNKFPSNNKGVHTYYLILSNNQEIKVFAADYDTHNLGDIIEMECVSFGDPSLPRETKKLGSISTL